MSAQIPHKRRIAVITGSRADYGNLYWLLKEITDDQTLELSLMVTGAHLDDAFGATHEVITNDGFEIDARIELAQKDDTHIEVTKAMGRGMIGFANAFSLIQPDIVVVLGDRFEILSAVSAALIANIPIAHIHGGETTEGAFDDSIRHAVTKMAHIHFAAAQTYANRIVQMGEMPERVFVVGAPGLDQIDRLSLPGHKNLASELSIAIDRPFFLITYHPTTLGGSHAGAGPKALVAALEAFPEHTILITGVNADPGHSAIAKTFETYAAKYPNQVYLRTSLGSRLYLAAMKYCDCVIGNSSSGIIEAPALGVASVNIGERQQGRLRASSIIDCADERSAICDAIERAISPEFRASFKDMRLPYGRGKASKIIKDQLKKIDLDTLLYKKFHDIQRIEATSHGA